VIKSKWGKLGAALAGVTVAVLLGAGACDDIPQDASSKAKADRAAEAAKTIPCGATNESPNCKNLAERRRREADPNKKTYIYLYNFDGSIKGYFVAKGVVSSTLSQMGPTDTVIYYDKGSYGNSTSTVEAPGDDGTYGTDAPGIFFFTANGVYVQFSGDYVASDAPLPLKVKNLETNEFD